MRIDALCTRSIYKTIILLLGAAVVSTITNCGVTHVGAIGAPFTSRLLWSLAANADSTISNISLSSTMEPVSFESEVDNSDSDSPAGDSVDHSLYSRQLFVYGKSSQKRLQQAHVLIVGDDVLAAEIAKNLALAGVGRISFLVSDSVQGEKQRQHHQKEHDPRLQGSSDSLAEYTRLLNKYNEVHEISPSALQWCNASGVAEHEFTAVVVTDKHFSEVEEIDTTCRNLSVPLVCCSVFGTVGVVFNDFGESFHIDDVEGETFKEIPLERVSEENMDDIDSLTLRLRSIPEEKLELGIGDSIDMTASWMDSFVLVKEDAHRDAEGRDEELRASSSAFAMVVEDVIDTHTVLVNTTSGARSDLLKAVRDTSNSFVLKKMKTTKLLQHEALRTQLRQPKFTACNECLSPRKDKAISLVLLAAMKVYGRLSAGIEKIADTVLKQQLLKSNKYRTQFRSLLIKELQAMGVKEPLLPLKQRGVTGAETIDRIVGMVAHNMNTRCPVLSSVVGATASQEVIKAVTHMHVPAEQFLMFEAMNAQCNDHMSSNEEPSLIAGQTNHRVESVYGTKIAEELSRLKIFVVGAGAIGCELLKNFALLGVGTKASSTDEMNDGDADSVPTPAVRHHLWRELCEQSGGGGGTIVTDMDHIERSNLNRQLLFRERHIGQPKSAVAAEQVKDINPHLQVTGITQKLSSETEDLFDCDFWADADIIVTALDNVDARRYVDERCVKFQKWLLDSGTLGTKGNTQVVIPFLTESYSTSSDPPDDSIPLCTLKSFPYQIDHCVAWAKAKFEEYFVKNIFNAKKIISSATEHVHRTEQRGKKLNRRSIFATKEHENESKQLKRLHIEDVRPWLDDMNTEEQWGLVDVLRSLHGHDEVHGSVSWAIREFNRLFFDDVEQLIQEHPEDELDEDGVPFWSGSRRFPVSFRFDPYDPLHRLFAIAGAKIHSRITLNPELPAEIFAGYLHSANSTLMVDQLHANTAGWLSASPHAQHDPASHITFLLNELNKVGVLKEKATEEMQAEDFEKDDESLGHVDFVAAMSNLRSRTYSLREIETLEVQKIAGNIIPALATTTSLVAGLVTLEVIKFAAERVRYREEKDRQRRATAFAANTAASTDTNEHTLRSVIDPFIRRLRTWRSSFTTSDDADDIVRGSFARRHQYAGGMDREYLLKHSERILSRFANAFVNVARPMLAFAQPLEPVSTPLPAALTDETDDEGRIASFNLWDSLLVPECETITELTVQALDEYLFEKYGVAVQSLSLGDMLLFADFLPDSEESATEPLLSLIRKAMMDDDDGGDDRTNNNRLTNSEGNGDADASDDFDLHEAFLRRISAGDDFILLDVACVRATAVNDDPDAMKDEDTNDSEVNLPPVKVYIRSPRSTMDGDTRSTGRLLMQKMLTSLKNIFRSEG